MYMCMYTCLCFVCGVCVWCVCVCVCVCVTGLPAATHQLVTTYTDQLLKDGIITRILTLLNRISVSGELARLEKGRAIGSGHHRRQIVELIEGQRSCLSDCLFLWSVQTPFGREETIQMIEHVRKIKVCSGDESSPVSGGNSSGSTASQSMVAKATVDVVTVSLCMTMMSCFNIGEDTVDQSDDSLLSDHYPLLSDASFLPAIHAEITKVCSD